MCFFPDTGGTFPRLVIVQSSAPLAVEGAGASRQQSPFRVCQSINEISAWLFIYREWAEKKNKRGPWGLKVKVRALQGQGTGCERLTGANSLRAEI